MTDDSYKKYDTAEVYIERFDLCPLAGDFIKEYLKTNINIIDGLSPIETIIRRWDSALATIYSEVNDVLISETELELLAFNIKEFETANGLERTKGDKSVLYWCARCIREQDEKLVLIIRMMSSINTAKRLFESMLPRLNEYLPVLNSEIESWHTGFDNNNNRDIQIITIENGLTIFIKINEDNNHWKSLKEKAEAKKEEIEHLKHINEASI
ncbi:MAG: hypothetical protein FWH40_08005 [Coriobacteriia bacterium]|nr:hypothetical protein [Coriobacteriia bacterium]MCL2137439.1 hypothetical protein [Coriobacteriia bacterium]